MGEASFTPGPWRVGISVDNEIHCVDAEDQFGGVTEIAEVWGTVADKEETSESRANARLIAAAPDLYHALDNLLIAIGIGWDLDGVIDVSKDALAKANGETAA